MHTFHLPSGRSSARRLATAALASLLAAGSVAAERAPPKAQPAELPAETLSVVPALTSPERVYVADFAINHISDGRIRVFDARSGRLLGIVSTGYAGNFALSAKADELYVATTYLSRGTRGERADVLEVHDTSSLAFKYEVLLPPKRAQALTYRGLVQPTANGRFVLVQNATPATSVTVVDLQQRKAVNEIATPGCWGIHASSSHASRFSMLCGEGKVATVTLDDGGQVTDRQAGDKLFDADMDAWFHHAENVGDRTWFVSFKGNVTELDLGGPVAVVKRPAWSLAAGTKGGWRPGGYQVFAVDPSGRWLVAAMHDKGVEGSHKRPARQLWVFDLNTGKRVSTVPGHGAVSLSFSRNGQRLHALNGETGELVVWQWSDNGSLGPMTTIRRAGESAIQVESQD
ncbi:MAG: amine dehydrogenase [Burkholderiales bacterium]|nr:amine dehydrogenase [Burkholderiales bacterium]